MDQTAIEPHDCDPEVRASYLMFGLRQEIATFDSRLGDWLASSQGLFETWVAARKVRQVT